MEAVAIKVRQEDEKARKDAERDQWKKETEHLKKFQ